jgi:hypothetical protein
LPVMGSNRGAGAAAAAIGLPVIGSKRACIKRVCGGGRWGHVHVIC